MSRKVVVQFEVHSAEIMRDTLEELNIVFSENKAKTVFTIKHKYNNIEINSNTNQITHDDTGLKKVNKIKRTYAVNWYRDRAIKEGMQIREEVNAKGQIELHVYQ